METAIFYPGAKNDTVQRVMYIERPCVAGKWVYLTVKRTLDTCFALIGLIVFTRPMPAIALIIALDSPGDPIFKPRPERACFYRKFEQYIIGFSNRLTVIPGLTGYAQVNGGYDLKPEEKIIYDMVYIERRSVWMDLRCILKTVGVVLRGDGAR